jgi:hypothetical protein
MEFPYELVSVENVAVLNGGIAPDGVPVILKNPLSGAPATEVYDWKGRPGCTVIREVPFNYVSLGTQPGKPLEIYAAEIIP